MFSQQNRQEKIFPASQQIEAYFQNCLERGVYPNFRMVLREIEREQLSLDIVDLERIKTLFLQTANKLEDLGKAKEEFRYPQDFIAHLTEGARHLQRMIDGGA